MASVYHLVCDASFTISHIIEKDREYDKDRTTYHYAALLIQRVYRGYLVRKEIAKWHAAATIIQKYVRRWLVKINMARYMLEFLEHMAMSFYNKCATKIQAWWRGNYYRKHFLNLAKMFAERKRLKKINEDMIERMKREKLRSAEYQKWLAEQEAKKMVLFILFKLHHLLRTDQEGIYSIHGSKQYSWIEQLFRTIKFTKYMNILHSTYNRKYQPPQEPECIMKGRRRECEKAYYLRDISKDKKPVPPPDPNQFILPKKFCFDPKYKKKYEMTLLTAIPFAPRITQVLRVFNKYLNIYEEDFDITKRMVGPKLDVPPYYLDFWNKVCEIHNFVGDFDACKKK